jgi:hypothetical protein
VVTKGRDYFVRLLRVDNGRIFAIAPTRYGSPSAVEQTADSSRYFVLRIEDGKGALGGVGCRVRLGAPLLSLSLPRSLSLTHTCPSPLPSLHALHLPSPGNHAFIAIAFNKREDAFDLKSCLADVEKAALAVDKGVDLGLGDVSSDLLSGFAAGQKISISMGKKGGSAAGEASGAGAAAAGGGGGLQRLPMGRLPPPGSAAASAAAAGGAAAAGAGSGGWDLLGGQAAAPQQSSAAAGAGAAAAAAPVGGDWETF